MANSKIWRVLYKENKSDSWAELEAENGYWYADPMLFQYKGDRYLFTEAFNEIFQIGYLAVSKYVDGKFTKPTLIMKRFCHLSYPCVFEYEDNIYMIPETGQNGTLELWKAEDDLFHWKKDAILLKHVRFADNTVLNRNGKLLLFSYWEIGEFSTHVYELNLKLKKVRLIEKVKHDSNQFRPGGFFYEEGNKLYRPVQYNVNSYGERIIIKEVLSVTPFVEKTVKEIIADEYGNQWKGMSTHTYAKMNDLTAVDVLDEVDLPIYKRLVLIRKVRNVLFKLKYKLIG